jgi:glycosyltransferase involved in cell wall biosynthesis
LADYISLHNLEQWITLMGAIPNDKVVEEMQVADAFILCSKTAPNGDREGTPTALVEAQAVGLPCISTRHAGIPEMIPEETHCLLADEEEINQIADRIRQFLKCKPREIKQIARRGRAKIEREFNLRREVEKLKSIYSGILDIRYGAS